MKKLLLLTTVILLVALHLQAQYSDSLLQLPPTYLDNVSSKASQLQHKLDRKSEKAFQQLIKQESKIKRKLTQIDSLKEKELFGDAEQQYKRIRDKTQNISGNKQYFASLDTLVTSLKFLQQNPQFISSVTAGDEKLKHALTKVTNLEDQFQKAEEIKKFIQERKQFLRDQLSNLGFTKELKKISKTGYYHAQYISEIMEMVKDKRRAERKALELLGKTSLFKKFFRKNSHLASLFRMPGEPDDPVNVANLAGLQSRASVNTLIQNQLAAGGPNAQQQLHQNIAQAQSQLSEVKNKIIQKGGASSTDEMPDGFIENQQRKKSFWKKWETGLNMQNNRANGIMPVSSDIGISAGFKPNNWFTAGGGFAGRIGWGKSIRHISVSYSGISLRSFVEIKIPSLFGGDREGAGSFQAVAAFEKNYRPEIRNIDQLKDKSGWRNSGLAGVSKVIPVKSKFFKKTKLSLLWDFLSYQQLPKSQPVVLRFGYTF